MEMHFTPHVQAELDQLVLVTGCSPETLVNDLLAGYFSEQAEVRHTLDSRYDDIKSGRVKLVDGDEMRSRLDKKIKALRAQSA
jgi:hypothetical protein